MRKFIFLIIILFLLCGCSLIKDHTSSESEQKYVTTQMNKHLKIQFQSIEHDLINREEGFWLHFLIERQSGAALTEQNYSFSLPNQLTIDDHLYETKEKKVEFVEDQAKFSQFFTPRLQKTTDSIPITLFIKPSYYKQEVIFDQLTNGSKNIVNNDMVLLDVEVDGKELNLIVNDVHSIVGLKSALLINNEEIYPTFSNTEINKRNNTLFITHTFATPLPEKFTMKFTRHRLEEVVWNAPFLLPAKK